MNQKPVFILLISLLLAIPVFAQQDSDIELIIPPFNHLNYIAAIETNDNEPGAGIPQGLLNNEFYLESIRLKKLAQDTFDFGDYDASSGFAEEALHYAILSDEYIVDQLLAEVKRLINWADSNNIKNKYPNDYAKGREYYDISLKAQSNEELNDSIEASKRAIQILAALQAGKPLQILPGKFTVRSWGSSKDCLWNIAGYPGVYGEPRRWTELFEANKSKLPDPNNPNWIEPGIVLDIPSIRGEIREGMWDPKKTY
ncbi:MAG: LysM peptidoglycan-binding domain-containing protein [Treponema sp.]|jgi:hypothetical protein|nr:LysM peptidoglycan-binding domain-containing protein [Treponema sp.]